MSDIITNAEVLNILNEKRNASKNTTNDVQMQNKEYVEIKTIKYISGIATSEVSLEKMEDCIAGIKEMQLGLTEAEVLQILNLGPTTEVEFCAIIEESGERLTDEQMGELIEYVVTTLGLEGEPIEAEEMEEAEWGINKERIEMTQNS